MNMKQIVIQIVTALILTPI